jgi:hypothetical protein
MIRTERHMEAMRVGQRGALYRQIAAVFDDLPDRFNAAELYARAAIKSHRDPHVRMTVASILNQDFHCDQIVKWSGRTWRKRPLQR